MSKKGIGILLTCIILSATGCFWNDKDKTNDIEPVTTPTPVSDKEALSKKMTEMENKAKQDIENTKEVAKDDIERAVAYIDEHINDPFKDKEVSEKLAYYGAYLKYVGARTTEGAKHELAKLGDNVHTYVKGVYTKTEEETSKVSSDLKEGIHKSLEGINKAKDDTIEAFHKLVK